MSDEEFLALLEVKHGKSNGLNHAVNLSTGIVIRQEVTESCSKQVVSRRKKTKSTRIRPRIPQENAESLSDSWKP